MAVLGEDRLGVELYPGDLKRAVAYTHDLPYLARFSQGPRRDLQTIRYAVLVDHQRMIASRLEGISQSLKHIDPFMINQ